MGDPSRVDEKKDQVDSIACQQSWDAIKSKRGTDDPRHGLLLFGANTGTVPNTCRLLTPTVPAGAARDAGHGPRCAQKPPPLVRESLLAPALAGILSRGSQDGNPAGVSAR